MRQLIDTITAISTPIGQGGIGIVRMSGPESISTAKKIFRRTGAADLSNIDSHRMLYGHIVDPEMKLVVDEVMLAPMVAPHTFTREDIVEIHCHGGVFNIRRILNLTLVHGARLAEPGEFTKRAFLNGRINLLQVEGIIDLIKANTELAHESAVNLLDNNLYTQIEEVKKGLLAIGIEVEAEIDFSEEDIYTAGPEDWAKRLHKVLEVIDNLIATYDRGKIVSEGLKITIAGRPNVGKSSLMNRLLKEERAIVSDMPGTTRDSIEESLSLNGIAVQIIDTAGLQDTDDPIEREGIRRSKQKVLEASMVLLVFDGSNPLTEQDLKIIETLKRDNKHVLYVVNKIDKDRQIEEAAFKNRVEGPVFNVSAQSGAGLEALFEGMYKEIWKGEGGSENSVLITKRRHFDLLVRTRAVLERAALNIGKNFPIDIFAEDIKQGSVILGEMTGDTYSDEVLDRIFSEFCVGK